MIKPPLHRPPGPAPHAIEHLLGHPLPAYEPLVPHPPADMARPPREGELAWLLAYCLPDEYLQRGSRVWLETAGGPVEDDPGLVQAWAHARRHCAGQTAPGPSAPCFAPPLPRTPDAGPLVRRDSLPVDGVGEPTTGLSELEKMLTRLTMEIGNDFMMCLADENPPEGQAMLAIDEPDRLLRRAAAASHVLDVPLGRLFARGCPYTPREAGRWTAMRAFGRGTWLTTMMLRKVAGTLIEEARARGPGAMPAADFAAGLDACRQYVLECLARIEAMPDGFEPASGAFHHGTKTKKARTISFVRAIGANP